MSLYPYLNYCECLAQKEFEILLFFIFFPNSLLARLKLDLMSSVCGLVVLILTSREIDKIKSLIEKCDKVSVQILTKFLVDF